MKIGVIDLGINNYRSVMNAFDRLIAQEDQLIAIQDGSSDFEADLVVLPGLGHFESGMNALRKTRLDEYIFKRNRANSKIVGICLGMQLLGSSSEEAPEIKGLSLVDARSIKLPSSSRVPHIGWNSVSEFGSHKVFPSLSIQKDFYFVHSYHVRMEDDSNVLTQTPFGETKFTSSLIRRNIAGFQFHPEKSGSVGRELLSDIYKWANLST
jgi:glutamine amidotransferase